MSLNPIKYVLFHICLCGLYRALCFAEYAVPQADEAYTG